MENMISDPHTSNQKLDAQEGHDTSPNFNAISSPYQDDENNFKLAKAISYDLSGEFQNFQPHVEGVVQAAVIGNSEIVEFDL